MKGTIMRPARVFSLAVLMCALGALTWSIAASATESRPEWQVTKGGVKQTLKAGESEALSQSITTIKNWVFKQTEGTGITVECNSLKFNSASGNSITGLRAFKAGAILFTGCKVTAPAGDTSCETSSTGFPNGQIRTQALGFFAEEALEGSTKAPKVRWRPESTHEEIVTLELKGGSCTHAGSYEIEGLLVANIDTSAQQKAHKWEFTKNTGTRLTIGGVEAQYSGTGEFTLSSGNEWGDG
ncbi:MAG TPA: hypothetical protein VG898_12580 [Solirubrobacterales bacterium]|nr:hypothetical protein [Solirubrobacterales bacterium]